MDIKENVLNIARSAKAASQVLARLSSEAKNRTIMRMASELTRNQATILKENQKDLKDAAHAKLSSAMLDRLKLDEKRIKAMADALEEVAKLPDPVGEITRMWRRPNGLLVGRQRIPLGVIGIIYEARPNVTADAAGLCLKSGNAVILRGGSEALNSNCAIVDILQNTCSNEGLPKEAIQIVPMTSREAIAEILKLEEYIDLIIPRGGEGLIRMVTESSRIPVIKHYKGVCHIFVDEFADLEMAKTVCMNAKVQRPGVCNAMETLLIHNNVAKKFLPEIVSEYKKAKVELRGCPRTCSIIPNIKKATEDDWYTEYLDLILAIKVVDNLDEAIAHIAKYGSLHTESIITRDYNNAQKFLREVNSSTVLVNASTRLSDGFELGLGAEIGISTSKIHAFGPMGLEGLTTQKFIVYGNGQIRK